MAHGDHQDDDDDFMELPSQNHATGRTKDGDEATLPLCFNLTLSFHSSVGTNFLLH